MSLGQEAISEMEAEQEIYRQKVERQLDNKEWNGIKIKDMTDRHIINCINWIEANDKYDLYLGYLKAFRYELRRRRYANL